MGLRGWVGLTLLGFVICALAAPYCSQPGVGGSLEFEWDKGAPDCSLHQTTEPAIQVHQYNQNTFILRERKCVHYEAPFMYLLFGDSKVILLDTGATTPAEFFPLQETVEAVISDWLNHHNSQLLPSSPRLSRSAMELVVAHTHAHDDHVAADAQFYAKPYTTVVGHSPQDVAKFFGVANWPSQVVQYSLGRDRQLTIIPIPGHEPSSIAVYDCQTRLLLTGDSLYPGRLYVRDWQGYKDSINRLTSFVTENNLEVAYVLGTHVEMSDSPGMDYATGTTYQPREHKLELSKAQLLELNAALQRLPSPTQQVHDDFIIYPRNSQPLPQGGRVSTHGMTVLHHTFDVTAGSTTLLLSHVPTYPPPHDFQVVIQAEVTPVRSLSAVVANENTAPIGRLYDGLMTVAPNKFSLNDLIEQRITQFGGQLFQGNFEDGGTVLADIQVTVTDVLFADHLQDTDKLIPFSNLRYYSFSYNDSSEMYLIHHIYKRPDFDHTVRVRVTESARCSPSKYEQGSEWLILGGATGAVHDRLKPSSSVSALLVGDPNDSLCTFEVLQELNCLLGPGFDEPCDPK